MNQTNFIRGADEPFPETITTVSDNAQTKEEWIENFRKIEPSFSDICITIKSPHAMRPMVESPDFSNYQERVEDFIRDEIQQAEQKTIEKITKELSEYDPNCPQCEGITGKLVKQAEQRVIKEFIEKLMVETSPGKPLSVIECIDSMRSKYQVND